MTKTQMPNMKFNWPLILLIEWMIKIAALFFFLVISSATIAQFEGSSLTREGQFEVEWLSSEDTLFPVGKFAPVDGFWLDEVPWSVFELTLPADWGSAQDLVTQPDWSVIEAEDLTERQRHLLQLEKTHCDLNWRFSVVEQALIAQIQSPLLRYDTEREQYEKLEQFRFTLGAMETSGSATQPTHFERTRNWPLSSPLSDGDFIRISIPSDGVYRIDKDWIQSAGFDPDTLDPRKLRLFGNGGEMLPTDNAEDRPLGLLPAAIHFEGEEDGVWDAEDALYFWGEGPDDWKQEGSVSNWPHQNNDYNLRSWYFLQLDGAEPGESFRIEEQVSSGLESDTLITTYWSQQFHELELESVNRSGREWFGESFGTVTSRTFTFSVPYATEKPGTMEFRVAAQSMGASSSFALSAGEISANGSPSYTSQTSTSNVANLASGSQTGAMISGSGLNARIDVDVDFVAAVPGALGWLDYVRIVQECDLNMAGPQLSFYADQEATYDRAEYRLTQPIGLKAVWDVTDGNQPVQMILNQSESFSTWKASLDTIRRFVAFSNYGILEPVYNGRVDNLDLHQYQRADLVIVTRAQYMEAAQRLANIHADEGLGVLVVTQRSVFDEFSSGSVDPTAIKMLMMMLRDRALQGGWDPPRYLQLFGDGTFANRSDLMATPFIVTYQSENSISPTSSYVSDDYFGFLEDQYGEGIGDKMAIGVGRIACSSADEANAMVDKIEAYLEHPSAEVSVSGCADGAEGDDGRWRNRVCFVSDDMDGNGGPTEIEHMQNSDEHAEKLAENHPEYDVVKIYLDAYPQESTPGGERYPDAQDAIDRQVQDGALIVNYIGHGGEKGWSHERVLNTTTIQNWSNLERMPLFMTATCELARYDDPEVDSAGEMMVMNPDGGAIAMLTTTRVVFSGPNQQLNRAFYDVALFDTAATTLRLGDIARATKNDPQVSNSSNKRNFTLLGDVALRLNYPEHMVQLTSVPDTLKALDQASVAGYVSDGTGALLNDFSGIVHVKVFDKPSQITSLNNDDGPNSHAFEVHRNVLFSGVASVEDGQFNFDFVVPRDIDYSFGQGRISAYAVSDSTDAHGATNAFVIGGVSEDFVEDLDPPQVELYINDTLFESGGLTDDKPLLLARLYDAGGINSSGVGIGHDIRMILDEESIQSVVLNDFYTSDLNTYQGGTVRYAFSDLEDGPHSLKLTAWDVFNNKGTGSIDFVVASNFEAALGEVLAFPNPSSAGFQFSIEHNQVCQEGLMTLEVFSSQGRLVHSAQFPWHVEGFKNDEVHWDARNQSTGSQVAGGVYVFRVSLQAENGSIVQYADQIVVLRP
jgi:hypothetical protein